MSLQELLKFLITDNNNIAAFLIVHIFRQPGITKSHISRLRKNIIAIITCIVFEIA